MLDTLLQAADDARQPGSHLLHGLHQLAHLIVARSFRVQAQLPGSDALGAANHPFERADHRPRDQPPRQYPHQQRQAGSQGDGHGIARQLSLHRLLVRRIGLIDPLRGLLGTRLQLRLDTVLFAEQVGVFVEFVGEAGDMPLHLAQHALVARIADRRLELLDQPCRLNCLGDAACGCALLAFAALVQAHACLVHGLQHQAGYLAHLRGLLKELPALLAL
ncbi:hypothetical protein D3C81_1027420 [compost metagenome]